MRATTQELLQRCWLVAWLALCLAAGAHAESASQYNIFIRPPDEPNGVQGWIGDPIPYYRDGQFHIFYLHEKRPNGAAFHPWHEFTTSNFASYDYSGLMIDTGGTSDQDLALGTGSIIAVDRLVAHWSFDNPVLPPVNNQAVYRDSHHDIALNWDGSTGVPVSTGGVTGAALGISPGSNTRLYANQNGLNPTGSFSFSFFVNPYQLSPSVGSKLSLIGKESSAGATWGVEMLDSNVPNAAKLNFFVFDQDSAADVQSTTGQFPSEISNAIDTWHHVAGTYDATNGSLSLYLDGTKFSKVNTGLSGKPASDNGAFIIGSRQGGFNLSGISAAFDDLQLYNGVLNDQQIGALQQNPGATLNVLPDYYAFYTGHNWMFPAQGKAREGIMLAKSSDLNTWTKDATFTTLFAPGNGSTSIDRDEFRDPYVFADPRTNGYTMLVSSRNKLTGGGLLLEYRSADLTNWTVQSAPFLTLAGGPIPECSNVFQMGDKWYLTYSKPSNGSARGMYYRMSTSLDGPWSSELKLEGRGFFAGNTTSDGMNRYMAGWVYTREGETNAGAWQWAGNLVVHQLTTMADGTLSLSAPAAVSNRYNVPEVFSEVSRFGTVSGGVHNFTLSGTTASVNFNAISGSKKVTGEFSFDSSVQDFGLTIGGSENRIVLYPSNDEIRYGDDIVVPMTLVSNTTYTFSLFAEGSVAVLYVAEPNGKSTAVTMRNYLIQNNTWGLFSKSGQVAFSNINLNAIGLLGDFNHDGTVNAADYTVWREGRGTIYSDADYDVWRSHYGDTIAALASASLVLSVPEPSAWGCVFLMCTLVLTQRGAAHL